MFIAKKPNQEQDSEIFIMDSGATSQMVNLEDNMTNLKETETKVTIGDRKNLTRKKCGDWSGWQKDNRKLHHVTLTNTAAISALYANLFNVTRAL